MSEVLTPESPNLGRQRWRRRFVDNVISATDVAPFPIVLQRRARVALRQHLLRGVTRGAVLVALDATTLYMLRSAMHLLRDSRVAGTAVADIAGALIPRGTFPTIQFLAAMGIGLLIQGAYGPGDMRRDARRVGSATALGIALMFWGQAWAGLEQYGYAGFLIAGVIVAAALIAERQLVDWVVTRIRPTSGVAPRTLLVGAPRNTAGAGAHAGLADQREFHIVGSLDVTGIVYGEALDVTERLVTAIARDAVDTIVLCGSFDEAHFREIIEVADAAGCHLYSMPRIPEFSGLEPQLVWRRGAPLIQLTRPGVRGQHLFGKRMLDICGAAVGLAFICPLMLAIAVAVKVSSPGPILFRQRRVGRGGRCFSILKFRSMVSDAEQRREQVDDLSIYGDARLFKIVRDPRVTSLGAFLRRTSLDELPQLWNVLRGEMSLVGPRPSLPSEVKLYDARHYGRFHMKPGITGPWQVAGRNGITDFESVVRLEASYMWQWSLWKDITILLRTVPVVLRMRGAH